MKTIKHGAEFADQVEKGSVRQAIRKARKMPIEVGDVLSHHCSQRPKGAKTLRTSTCTQVRSVVMAGSDKIFVTGRQLTQAQASTLALASGFKSPRTMCAAFEESHGLPFTGQVINW